MYLNQLGLFRHYPGTMTRNVAQDPENFRRDDAALYSLERDGSIRTRAEGISLSNGLAWTADNKTMYFVDSLPRTIYAYDFDVESGDMSRWTT